MTVINSSITVTDVDHRLGSLFLTVIIFFITVIVFSITVIDSAWG